MRCLELCSCDCLIDIFLRWLIINLFTLYQTDILQEHRHFFSYYLTRRCCQRCETSHRLLGGSCLNRSDLCSLPVETVSTCQYMSIHIFPEKIIAPVMSEAQKISRWGGGKVSFQIPWEELRLLCFHFLFCQDATLPDVLRLWDSFIADPNRYASVSQSRTESSCHETGHSDLAQLPDFPSPATKMMTFGRIRP